MMNSLYLDGRPGTGKTRLRFLAVISGKEYWLRQKEFTYLVHLAMAKSLAPDGTVSIFILEPRNCDDAAKYVWRLRQELAGSGLEIETIKRKESYRLRIDSLAIGFDLAQLRQFPDYTIRRMFRWDR